MVRNFRQARISRAFSIAWSAVIAFVGYALIFTTYENNEHRIRSQVNSVNEVNEDAVTELQGWKNRFLD